MINPNNFKAHLFNVGEQAPPETWSRPGKPEWPHSLHLEFATRYQAWSLVNSLLGMLREEESGGTLTLSMSLVGKLSEIPDE